MECDISRWVPKIIYKSLDAVVENCSRYSLKLEA